MADCSIDPINALKYMNVLCSYKRLLRHFLKKKSARPI